MAETSFDIPGLIRQSVAEPRAAARTIINLHLPAPVAWQALALVVVLSVITAQVTSLIAGLGADVEAEILLPSVLTSPIAMGVIQGGLLVVTVFAIHWVGRSMGGTGRFEDAAILVTWLQFLLVCLQVVQALATLVMPPLASLLGLAGIVAFFYLLTLFVTELHGFKSPGAVFVMILVSMVALTFALSLILAILGVTFVGEVPDV